MALREALTIAEAASRLGVTPARVHQLLQAGRLKGPAVVGPRARPGAARVWASSLNAEMARRSSGEVRAVPPTSGTHTIHTLKVALDTSREALKQQRDQTARVTELLAQAVAALQVQERLTAQSDALADGYSDALTQLLAPGDPRGLT